jgi:hypothetical protein
MSRSTLVFALLALAPALVAQQSPQGESYNLANQHTYLLTASNVGWQEARAWSRTVGGYLVAINDAAEQNYIVATYANTSYAYWIGLSDAASEGSFVWDSGEPVTYSNFCSGEPNNYLGIEDYVEIFSTFNGYLPCWNDDSSPNGGYGIPATRGIVEIPFGKRLTSTPRARAAPSAPFPPRSATRRGPKASRGTAPEARSDASRSSPASSTTACQSPAPSISA